MLDADPISTALIEILDDAEVAFITNYIIAATVMGTDGTEHIVLKVPDGGSWAALIGLSSILNSGLQTVAAMIGAPPIAGGLQAYDHGMGDEDDE